MVGYFAASRAGHDKDRIYIIIKEEKDYVYLSDGKYKTAASPKRKNKKHVQIIKKDPETQQDRELLQQLRDGRMIRDEEIKYLLKQYNKVMHISQ